jgi:hypothetical protein
MCTLEVSDGVVVLVLQEVRDGCEVQDLRIVGLARRTFQLCEGQGATPIAIGGVRGWDGTTAIGNAQRCSRFDRFRQLVGEEAIRAGE